MVNLVDEGPIISKDRMLIAICLIMILEHKDIDLQELIHATGLKFDEVRSATQNLSMLKLIEIQPSFRNIPRFKIKNIEDAKKFLKLLGF
ncbi:MAG: hypothetical protein INQ03_07375 [Candidatus Heimdallarchaeota archaeon]|nr:hypothetical protein [Candidatus Heimdallarchaeota archaeon]